MAKDTRKNMTSSAFMLGGYDLEFVSEPPDALMCLICTCVAKDPQQMNCCGRVYCQLCLSEHKRRSSKCPHCRQTGSSFVDKRSDREIRALRVKCTNGENGCQWEKELLYFEDHLLQCGYKLVQCTFKCEEEGKITQLLRRDLKNHLTKDCPRRKYRCPYCLHEGEYEERTGPHLQTCREMCIACLSDGCSDMFPRWMSSIHSSKCSYRIVACKYKKVGCDVKCLRKDLKTHEDDHQFHLRMTTESVLTQKQEIEKLREEVNRLTQQSNLAPQTFRLEAFEEKKTKNEVYHGKPFYTSRKGYKLHVRIYCNGTDNYVSTHVSVFANLMKGNYDSFLTWPLTVTVVFELLNQLEDKNHHRKAIAFTSNGDFSKEGAESKRKSTDFGFPQFISHKILGHKPMQNCQYLKDDTLIFRVSIQVPDYKRWLECTD